MNNTNVAIQWAKSPNQNLRGSNLFSEGNKIYSYGHHFCIAEITSGNTANFNSRKYSRTTSRHQSEVKQALLTENYQIIEMPL